MKKNIFVLCMVVCLLVTISVPAYAALPAPGIEPMAEYHFSSKASLTISSHLVGLLKLQERLWDLPG